MAQKQKIDLSKPKKNRGKTIFYWSILAFPLLQFVIFYIGVNMNSFALAFQEFDLYDGGLKFLGFNRLWMNFKAVFQEFQEAGIAAQGGGISGHLVSQGCAIHGGELHQGVR